MPDIASGTLTTPRFWRRFGSWLSFGLWNPDVGSQSPVPPGAGPHTAAGSNVTDARALQISAVFGCIRVIAQSVSALPLAVYERSNSGRKEVRDHWLAKLLDEPNPVMTGQELREAITASLAGWGNAYLEVNRNADGRPVELWPLKPEGMQVIRKNQYDGVVYRYTTSGGGNDSQPSVRDLLRTKVLHIKGFGTDGFTGMAPLGLARESLGLAVAAEQYGASFFANGGKPSGVMTIDKLLQPNQREQLRKQFAGMADDQASNGNRWWLLEAGLKYEAISIPPEDAQMLATRTFQVADIARFFGVPLYLLMEGSKDSNWGTGLEQQNLAFLTYCLHPYMKRIETAMARWLLTPQERATIYAEHNVEGLLRADTAARASFYSTMVQNGLYTRDEVRAKENLPKYEGEGGDMLTAQSNLMPLQQLGQTPAAAPTASPPAAAADAEDAADPAPAPKGMAPLMLALVQAFKDAGESQRKALEKIDDAILRASDREREPPVVVQKEAPDIINLHVQVAGQRAVARTVERTATGYKVTEVAEEEPAALNGGD